MPDPTSPPTKPEPDPSPDTESEERSELWRCPKCGAAGWYSTADYPLPGGPALCTHPTPTYERFVFASQLDSAIKRAEEAEATRQSFEFAAQGWRDQLAERDTELASLVAEYEAEAERHRSEQGALFPMGRAALRLADARRLRSLLSPDPTSSEGDDG